MAATKPLWGSLIPVTILLLSYLLFVLKIGKIFMKKRKAYDLKNILIAYNIFQVIYNGIMFYYICKYSLSLRSAAFLKVFSQFVFSQMGLHNKGIQFPMHGNPAI